MKTTLAILALTASASAMEVKEATSIATQADPNMNWCDMSAAARVTWKANLYKEITASWRTAVVKYYNDRNALVKATRAKLSAARGCAARRAIYNAYRVQRTALYKNILAYRTKIQASLKSRLAAWMKTAAQCEAEESEDTVEESETTVVESESTATASEESEATASEESEDDNCVAPKVFGNTCDRAILRALHEQKACLWKNNGSKTTKYVDVGFPASSDSANAGAWKRPSEMTTNPSLWGSKGVRPAAVQQGGLGDCWWLSTAAALAEEDDGARVKAVITNKNEATGIYEFKFFRNGNFEKVVIDDRLPVSRSSSRDSMYARKSPNGAWWVPLMEKAAAKFYGRYSNLVGGNMKQGWEMLTGMPSRSYTPSSVSDLKTLLDDADTAGHVINCNVSGRGCVNGRKNGLPCGHAYTLLEHTKWRNGDYVKIRNPWGSTEWNGALSDSDTSATAKSFFNDNAHPQANDGTFWMSTDDFKGNFYEVVVGDYIPTWKHSSKPVEWKRTSSTVAWNFGFTNPVAQAVSIGLLGNQDRVFMDDKCEHEDRIGYGYRVQRDQHFFKIQNSRGANQTGKDGKWYKIFSGLVADSYLRYDNLAAGTYAIKGVTDQAANKGRAGTLHFAANAWAQKQAIVFV